MKKIYPWLSLIILFLLITIVFKAWVVSEVISSGDSWYYFKSMYSNHFIYPYSWYNTVISNGLGGQGFAYVNVNIVVASVLELAKIFNSSWEIVSKIFFYIFFLLSSTTTSIVLIRKLFPDNKFWIFTPLVFVFNTYILMVVGGGQIITGISYSLIPASLYLVIKILDKSNSFRSSLKSVLIFSFIFSLQCILDLRIAFITFIAVGIYFLVSMYERFKFRKLFSLFVGFLLVALICSYWLLPMIVYGIDPISQLGVDYRSTEIVKFLSFAKLENSIALMHPYWPENIFGKIGFMKPEFLLLPILAFISLLFINKHSRSNKYIIYFSLIAIIGIFLGKGANEPFGNIYLFLFDNIPGFQLFRDSFKWYALIALSYSILISISISEIYNFIKSKKIFIKSNYFNLQNLFILILFLYILLLLKPAILGELNGTFKTRVVPDSYVKLNNYLSNDKEYFRALWIPQTMQFGHYTNTHTSIAGRDFFREYSNDLLLAKLSSDSAKKILEEAGVKYVIVPEDTESEIYLTDRKYDESKYKYIVENIDKIRWLKEDKSFGKIKVYKTESYKDHFWCDCNADIKYEFINPTSYIITAKNAKDTDRLIFSEAFDSRWTLLDENGDTQQSQAYGKYNSFSLPEGNSRLKVEYAPQKLVDLGAGISLITIILMAGGIMLIELKNRRGK